MFKFKAMSEKSNFKDVTASQAFGKAHNLLNPQ